jgi:hypothetical protein
MEPLESTSLSFIVKVWVEDSAEAGSQGVCHGHITHVPSGKRQYIDDLGKIEDFIAPHLEEMGVKLGLRWRLRRSMGRG